VLRYRIFLGLFPLLVSWALIGFVLFARPADRRPAQAEAIDGRAFPAPSDGWTWPHGEPGFQFGADEAHWNFSGIRAAELAPLRRAAADAGVDPRSLRLLQAVRLAPRDLSVLAAGDDARGRTCIGVETPARPATFFCPPALEGRVAVVVAAARRGSATGQFPLFLIGATRADVVRVTVSAPVVGTAYAPGGQVTTSARASQVVYLRGNGWWGTFLDTPGDTYRGAPPHNPWRARVDVYGKSGRLARLDVRLGAPGTHVFAVSRP